MADTICFEGGWWGPSSSGIEDQCIVSRILNDDVYGKGSVTKSRRLSG
jgi:hypothetical protein